VLQRPKIAPYVSAMRENIARSLELDIFRVSIKATTSEGLGFTGTGEGIVAQAIALLSHA
jgi:2-C-methyl-D-erythritol 2,4-cyclodiphosphate synthase